jgi:very-short-patch-repair endonuclease
MGGQKLQAARARKFWRLVEQQHGAIAKRQLLELGYTPKAIEHRRSAGRLHPIWRGVYAVGRRELSENGRLMAAVLACGPEAFASHDTAAWRWRIRKVMPSQIELLVPAHVKRARSGIVVHRCATLTPSDVTQYEQVPITTPIRTIMDLAARLSDPHLEAAINEADKLGYFSPADLRAALESTDPRPGIASLKRIIRRATFLLTDSELERLFLRLVRRAGLPLPETGRWLNGFKVDFYWPALGLVVETDGLRYHRTEVQQTRDRRRDQAHTVAGLTTLRFTHWQVAFEREYVIATLNAVASRLTDAA